MKKTPGTTSASAPEKKASEKKALVPKKSNFYTLEPRPASNEMVSIPRDLFDKMEVVKPLLHYHEVDELKRIMNVVYGMLQAYSLKEARRVLGLTKTGFDLCVEKFDGGLNSRQVSQQKRRNREKDKDKGTGGTA